MKRALFIIVLILIVVALGVGLWLGSRSHTPSIYRSERAAMSLQVARTMAPFQIAFRVSLGGVVLCTLGGLGWGVVRWLNHRVSTLYPNSAGLFPIREARIGKNKVFHDPNRAPTAATVYANGMPDLVVQQPMLVAQEAQLQVTGQAQAAQALRAAVSGYNSLPSNGPVSADIFDQRRLSRPLPDVTRLTLEPSHIERLLLESGEQ